MGQNRDKLHDFAPHLLNISPVNLRANNVRPYRDWRFDENLCLLTQSRAVVLPDKPTVVLTVVQHIKGAHNHLGGVTAGEGAFIAHTAQGGENVAGVEVGTGLHRPCGGHGPLADADEDEDASRSFRHTLRGFLSTGLRLAAILGVALAVLGYAAAFEIIPYRAANTLYVLGALLLLQRLLVCC